MIIGDGVSRFRAIWFIEILFIAEVLYYCISQNLGKYAIISLPLLLMMAFILQYYQVHSLYRFEAIPGGMFFVGLGNYFKKYIHKFLNYLSYNHKYGIAVLLFFLAVSLIRAILGHRTEFASNSLMLSDYAIAIFGVGFILLFSKMVSANRVLEFLGRNTIVILGAHIILIKFTVCQIETFFGNHWFFKASQQLIMWSGCLMLIWLINRFFPWAAGKTYSR